MRKKHEKDRLNNFGTSVQNFGCETVTGQQYDPLYQKVSWRLQISIKKGTKEK